MGQVVQGQMVIYTVQNSSSKCQGNGIAVDSQNHAVYVVGYGLGQQSAYSNLLFARYNDVSEEAVYWVTEKLLSGYSSAANAVAVNGSESIYVVGGWYGSPYSQPVFLKFATNGTLLFVQHLTTNGNADGYALAIDKENNIIITGGVLGDFQGLTNAGNQDIFVVKYSASGDLIYTKLYGTSSDDGANGIRIDSLNNIYLTGSTNGALNGETSIGSMDAFLMKLDSTGSVIYTKLFGETGDDVGNALVLDRDSNIYITGYISDTNGSPSLILTKFDSSGNQLYTKFSSTTNGYVYGTAIAIDEDNGFLYIVGPTSAALDNNAYYGGMDFILQKYSTNGDKIYTAQYGTTKDDYGTGVFVDDDHNVFITGSTTGNLSGQSNVQGKSNSFYMKLDGTTRTETPTHVPTQVPTQVPTIIVPSQVPTQSPSQIPTQVPTQTPSQVPTQIPSQVPTQVPTQTPSQVPTQIPSSQIPTQVPTQIPSQSFYQLMRKANSNAPLEDADIRAVRQAVAKEGGVD
eukprot:scaffold3486_cov185-Ochromonas_danica.AAC.1